MRLGTAEQAEVVCKDQIPVSRGPLGEGGYVHLHLADALSNSPCDDQGVVTVVYGFAQTSDIIDGMQNLRVSELWGKNNNGMPIMATDDITATTFCLKAPDLQFKPCGTMRFAVCGEPADDVQTSDFHFSTWKRIVQQFPAWRERRSAARQARFAQMRTLHTLEPQYALACKTPARGIVKLEIEPFVLISAETAHKRNIRMDDWAAAAFWVVVGFWLVTIYNTWRFMHRKDSVACTSKDLN